MDDDDCFVQFSNLHFITDHVLMKENELVHLFRHDGSNSKSFGLEQRLPSASGTTLSHELFTSLFIHLQTYTPHLTIPSGAPIPPFFAHSSKSTSNLPCSSNPHFLKVLHPA